MKYIALPFALLLGTLTGCWDRPPKFYLTCDICSSYEANADPFKVAVGAQTDVYGAFHGWCDITPGLLPLSSLGPTGGGGKPCNYQPFVLDAGCTGASCEVTFEETELRGIRSRRATITFLEAGEATLWIEWDAGDRSEYLEYGPILVVVPDAIELSCTVNGDFYAAYERVHGTGDGFSCTSLVVDDLALERAPLTVEFRFEVTANGAELWASDPRAIVVESTLPDSLSCSLPEWCYLKVMGPVTGCVRVSYGDLETEECIGISAP